MNTFSSHHFNHNHQPEVLNKECPKLLVLKTVFWSFLVVTALLQVHTAGPSKSMSWPSHLHIFDLKYYMHCLILTSLSYQAHPALCRECSVLRHPVSWVSYMSIKHEQGSPWVLALLLLITLLSLFCFCLISCKLWFHLNYPVHSWGNLQAYTCSPEQFHPPRAGCLHLSLLLNLYKTAKENKGILSWWTRLSTELDRKKEGTFPVGGFRVWFFFFVHSHGIDCIRESVQKTSS